MNGCVDCANGYGPAGRALAIDVMSGKSVARNASGLCRLACRERGSYSPMRLYPAISFKLAGDSGGKVRSPFFVPLLGSLARCFVEAALANLEIWCFSFEVGRWRRNGGRLFT
jgi:hypothetical protein